MKTDFRLEFWQGHVGMQKNFSFSEKKIIM